MYKESKNILIKLRELKSEIKSRFKVKEIELFGSYIRGGQRSSSDIDNLVDFEEGADLFNLIGLALFLEEKMQHKVDVVPKRALREELRDSVLKEAVSI
jgi:predicted nucleotidyltransferase